jgi:Ca2+-binding RTX toxin-like protein
VDQATSGSISITVNDNANGGSGGALSASTVISVAPSFGTVTTIIDSGLQNKKSLVIQGTTAADTITVTLLPPKPGSKPGSKTTHRVTIKNNKTITTDITEINGRILVFGLAGNDTIDTSNVNLTTYSDGGDGNDMIQGGKLADILIGGNGADTLKGNDGADFLIGGLGADTLWGGNGNDILVDGLAVPLAAGKTLQNALDSWAAAPNSATNSLTSWIGFTADKASKDTLKGELGADWFWSALAQNPGIGADILDTPLEKRRQI